MMFQSCQKSLRAATSVQEHRWQCSPMREQLDVDTGFLYELGG